MNNLGRKITRGEKQDVSINLQIDEDYEDVKWMSN